MLLEVFDELIEVTVDACRSVYGDRLRGVVVFGSAARGTERPDSDIDLLVVAEPLPDGRMARMAEFDAVEASVADALRRAWDKGVPTRLSPIVFTLDELAKTGFLLFDIACDGVVRFEQEGDVSSFLARVRSDLEARGAERRGVGGSRYWVLEPDLKPGEVVEL